MVKHYTCFKKEKKNVKQTFLETLYRQILYSTLFWTTWFFRIRINLKKINTMPLKYWCFLVSWFCNLKWIELLEMGCPIDDIRGIQFRRSFLNLISHQNYRKTYGPGETRLPLSYRNTRTDERTQLPLGRAGSEFLSTDWS